jgi:hypothetical protein
MAKGGQGVTKDNIRLAARDTGGKPDICFRDTA